MYQIYIRLWVLTRFHWFPLVVWPNTKYRNLQSNISSWSRDFNTCLLCLVIRTYRTNTDSWVPQQQHVLERASKMRKFRTLQSGYENSLSRLSAMQSGNIHGSMTRNFAILSFCDAIQCNKWHNFDRGQNLFMSWSWVTFF